MSKEKPWEPAPTQTITKLQSLVDRVSAYLHSMKEEIKENNIMDIPNLTEFGSGYHVGYRDALKQEKLFIEAVHTTLKDINNE